MFLEGENEEEVSTIFYNFWTNQNESWHFAVFPVSEQTRLILID